MKKAIILGISSNNKLIVKFDDGQALQQSKLEGFDISNDVTLRFHFNQLINKQIECSFNKNQKNIRYHNEQFLTKLLTAGAITVNKKQLEESKLLSIEQKIKYLSIQPEFSSQIALDLNLKENQEIISQLQKSNLILSTQIQCLDQYMLFSFTHNGKLCYLRCKLLNYKHYFQLFPQSTFYKDQNLLKKIIQIRIRNKKLNISSGKSQIYVTFQGKSGQQIQQKMLKQGWISLNKKSMLRSSLIDLKNKMHLTIQSTKQCKGIYSSKSQLLNFIYLKSNYVGLVTNIIQGYIFQITTLKTHQTTRIQLHFVNCPIGDDAGSYQCRQFARKQLIGREVNVYLQKEEGLNTTGSIVRTEDWKDVETFLLQNGTARVRDQIRNSMIGQKYTLIQNKAKQKHKGLHRKQLGIKRHQDLTNTCANKLQYIHRRYQILNQLSESQDVVIQQTISALNYRIRIDSFNILMNLRLKGIIEPNFNPKLKQSLELKQQSQQYLRLNFRQRNLTALINDYDKDTNCFVGTLRVDKQKKIDVQELLIKASLVYADKQNYVSSYIQLENTVKTQGKLIWQEKLKCFQPVNQLDRQNNCFQGKFSWIKDGKIAYIQSNQNIKRIQEMQQDIRKTKLQPLQRKKQEIGSWCAAPFCGQLYRAQIKQCKGSNITVLFIDWGNQEIVTSEDLFELPEQYLYVEKKCSKVRLNLVARTKNQQILDKIRQICLQGVYVFKRVYGDLVEVFGSQVQSLNTQLILKGLLKADSDELNIYEHKQYIIKAQQQMRRDKFGIWQQSQNQEEPQDRILSPIKQFRSDKSGARSGKSKYKALLNVAVQQQVEINQNEQGNVQEE